MKYQEVTIRTTTSASELMAQALQDCGASGAIIRDRDDAAFFVPADAWAIPDPSIREGMEEDVLVVGFFTEEQPNAPEAVRSRIEELRAMDLGGMQLGKATVDVVLVDEEDWANNWKQYYKPMRIGKRLIVKPSWEDYEALPGDVVLELDPGMAFGTGSHETTAMCLRLLEETVMPGMRVLDGGCGSGILSMAAAKLGARVTALDIDPLAVKITGENAKNAGLSQDIHAFKGDFAAFLAGDTRYELVVANIIADVIIGACGAIAQGLTQQGQALVSGIIRDREADVAAALKAAGLSITQTLREGEWVAMLAQKGAQG